jgi:hypothetical protein
VIRMGSWDRPQLPHPACKGRGARIGRNAV